MPSSMLALLVFITTVTVVQGIAASCEGHLDGCSSDGDFVSTTSQSLLQRKRNRLSKIQGDENETERSAQAGGVMDDPPADGNSTDAPLQGAGAASTSPPSVAVSDVENSAQAGTADPGIPENGGEVDAVNETDQKNDNNDNNDINGNNDNDEDGNDNNDNNDNNNNNDNNDNANDNNDANNNHNNDGEGAEELSRQFQKDVKKDAEKFVKAMTESEDNAGGNLGHVEAMPLVASNESATNYLCKDEGKLFATAKAADEYFTKQCLGVYDYNATLCQGLSDKVFEGWRQDMSVAWRPDQDICDEVGSLLRADTARRHEMGLPVVVATEPAAAATMLERSNRSSSASSSSTLDEVMRYKPISPTPPPYP